MFGALPHEGPCVSSPPAGAAQYCTALLNVHVLFLDKMDMVWSEGQNTALEQRKDFKVTLKQWRQVVNSFLFHRLSSSDAHFLSPVSGPRPSLHR